MPSSSLKRLRKTPHTCRIVSVIMQAPICASPWSRTGAFFDYNRRPSSLLGAKRTRQGILKESTWSGHCRLSASAANRSLSSITSCSGSSWCLYTVKLCPQPGQITFPARTYAEPHIERPGSSWRTNANMPLSSGHRSRLAIGLRCEGATHASASYTAPAPDSGKFHLCRSQWRAPTSAGSDSPQTSPRLACSRIFSGSVNVSFPAASGLTMDKKHPDLCDRGQSLS
jgi:hypothetical protein